MIKLYEVGGHVRDSLLGVDSKDIDMAVTAGKEYQVWIKARNVASRLHGEGMAYLDALRAKKEMAISLGFQKKFEAEMELRNSPPVS